MSALVPILRMPPFLGVLASVEADAVLLPVLVDAFAFELSAFADELDVDVD